MADDNLLRQFVHRRDQVIHETRRQQLTLLIIVIALVECSADALGNAAADMAR